MSDGTLQTLDVSMLEDVNNALGLVQLDSNAKIPACSGAALTNLPSPLTKSANDPTPTTNPVGGTGTVFQNTTSGEMYICTDDTAGSNVWKNIGGGSGDTVPLPDWMGISYGYHAGGHREPPVVNMIEKYSYTSDANSVDTTHDLLDACNYAAGSQTATYGYRAGGYPETDRIDKYQFAGSSNSTNVGNMDVAKKGVCGASTTTYGFYAGGHASPKLTYIGRYAFASDGNATQHGNLRTGVSHLNSVQSETHIFWFGGSNGSASLNYIDRYDPAAGGTAADWADLDNISYECGSVSGETHGYRLGSIGDDGNWANSNYIEKFPYASQTNATNIGDLTVARGYATASQSTTHGYCAGGYISSALNPIDKFLFASEGNATPVGDLVNAKYSGVGWGD